MVTDDKCRKILNASEETLSKEELSKMKDFLYAFAEIIIQIKEIEDAK